jgi:hypothetical protein
LVPAAFIRGVDYLSVSAVKSSPILCKYLKVSILQFNAAQWAAVNPFSTVKSNFLFISTPYSNSNYIISILSNITAWTKASWGTSLDRSNIADSIPG